MKKSKWLVYLVFFICIFTFCTSCKKNDDSEGDSLVKAQSEKGLEKYLNEKYKDYQEIEYGLDITKKTKIVSICYSTWFTKILGPGKSKVNPPNITEALAGTRPWGGVPAFHYWAEPALGYYRSDDIDVIRTHMTELADAGVDFIIIDNTNANADWKKTNDWNLFITLPCTAILNTIVEMRSEGLKTPYVVFWSKADEKNGYTVTDETYKQFYTEDKWKDCFVYWEGKPFTIVSNMLDDQPDNFTTRRMWGLHKNLATDEWSFLNAVNVPCQDSDGYNEQICVCAAAQENYMSDPSAHGRNHGIFFYDQWQNAFKANPKVVTLTWWNEWVAQESLDDEGNPRFVDAYTEEYSRDIEPMKGGHTDEYYQWMKEYIADYKNGEKCPRLVEEGY
ncbi:MAG: hypothetical protein LBI03_03160 [Clostridiales bacterium]|jgi:hypothetical protein|nr:hypothetical protein [Clostridiales bacterium]